MSICDQCEKTFAGPLPCGINQYRFCSEACADDWESARRREPLDPIAHPPHYTRGRIEVADFIADQRLDFARGNVVKYVCRAGHKDGAAELEDLKKARCYLDMEIRRLESAD